MFSPIKNFRGIVVAAIISAFVAVIPSSSSADTAQYVYDEIGRLIQITIGGIITNYSYDEVGNVLSVSNGSLTDIPSVTSISPSILITGIKTSVVFTGTNLLAASGVTSLDGNITVENVVVSPTIITMMLTANNASSGTVKVTFRDNNQTTYQNNFTIVPTAITLSPWYMTAPPNSTIFTQVSLSPAVASDVTVALTTGSKTIAVVSSSVTIPANGSAGLQITTKDFGITTIKGLNDDIYGYVIVENPIGGNGVTSKPISVAIALPSVTAPAVYPSSPISVYFPLGVQQPAAAVQPSVPISVFFTPSVQEPAPSVNVSPGISVLFQQ